MGGQNNNPTALQTLYRESRYICSEILNDPTYDLLAQKSELEKYLEFDPPPDAEFELVKKDYSFNENEEEGIHWIASAMARKLRDKNWFLGSRKNENDPSQAPSEYTDSINRG